jgi:hypothetical protein
VHAAERVPVDLLLLMDASGSMDELSGTQSKWQRARTALEAFVRDPASAGLGVGLQLFPGRAPEEVRACSADQDCAGLSDPLAGACRTTGFCFAPGLPLLTNRPCAPGLVSLFNCPAGLSCQPQGRCPQGEACVDGSACPGGGPCQVTPGRCRTASEGCGLAQFGKFDVDIGDLPGRADAVVAALAARQPDGATPMRLAVDSALTALAARQKSQPRRRPVLVLATDGLPSGCGQTETVDAVAARLELGRAANPTLPTYVVGVFAAAELAESQAALQRFAAAGGTKAPFILMTGDDLGQKLLQALAEIRGLAVACEYDIPRPQAGSLDFGKVNVHTSSQAGQDDPGYVTAPDRCLPDRGGWYFDPAPGNGTPARLVLCPASCDRLRADPAARVDLVFGCATRPIE